MQAFLSQTHDSLLVRAIYSLTDLTDPRFGRVLDC